MFLEKFAAYIINHEADQLEKKCFVFPNRRSGVFFRRFLIKESKKISWSPEIITINELIEKFSGLIIADPMDLLFQVYDIYKKTTTSPVLFDQFYPWGEMMIKDFDTIDKYLVDHKTIFQNILELKEIEDKFGSLSAEQIEFIRKFWASFHEGEPTTEKELFLTTWKILPSIYEKLNHYLRGKGEGYEGMLYRKVAGFNTVEIDLASHFDHYYFVGFNALSVAEQEFFKNLQKSGKASFIWDYDVLYKDDESMEAGLFIRENIKQFPPPVNLDIFSSFSRKSEIRIFDLPSDILQAKTLHEILIERDLPVFDPNDTAVVVCDENLLMPVLYSLPQSVKEVNVTMGYPFKITSLCSFIESIINLQRHVRVSKDKISSFYYKDVLSLLNHEYYQLVISIKEKEDLSADDKNQEVFNLEEKESINHNESAKKSLDDIIRKLKKENYVYVENSFFHDPFSKLIFREIQNVEDYCSYLDEILLNLLQHFMNINIGFQSALDKEYLLLLRNRISKLSEYFQGRDDIDTLTFSRFLSKMMAGLRIPFAGEPLSGLQVMGILESRLLDFKHVIMLSVNEEMMPGTANIHSLIPYGLRFAFGLPARDEMDAIYAYYFYRLIQRAEKIDLLYNSNSEGVSNGEMSRYLYQMKYQFNAPVIRPVLPVTANNKEEIHIIKTSEIIGILQKYAKGEESESYLSPSALNTYLTCSLKFYFRKVLMIREQEELLEEIDPIGFGNIIHHTLNDIYEQMMDPGKIIIPEKLKVFASSSTIDEFLERNFRKEYFKSADSRKIEGRNIIILSILKKYILKVIEKDMTLAPFRIIELEKAYFLNREVNTPDGMKEVKLGGKIDRVDSVSGITRIIDYKTGNANTQFSSIASLFDQQNPKRNKEAFQALLYALFFIDANPGFIVQPGLYVIKELFKEGSDSNFEIKGPPKENILDFNRYSDEFEEKLIELLEEIYNPEIPFVRTEVTDHCKYCDFKSICQRK